jgi:hypothetical protein
MVVNSLPVSTSLVEEINWLAPGRDKSSDGTVGDKAHADTSSDHNLDESGRTPSEDSDSIDEAHARDVDASGPWPPGWSMERIVQIILSMARLGLLPGLQNVIYNRRIWSRSWGWTKRAYTGSNPHDKHGHFGFRYGSGSGLSNPENFRGPWGIRDAREDELRLQQDWLAMATKEEVKQAVREVLNEDRPYSLARIGDRGWGPISDKEMAEYLFEAVVAAKDRDPSADAPAATAGSIPARLERIERLLAEQGTSGPA